MTPESSRYGQKRVLTKVAVSPKRPIRMISMELVKAKSTVHGILKAEHAYKLHIFHLDCVTVLFRIVSYLSDNLYVLTIDV